MDIRWEFALSVVLWLLVVGFFKALRDIIENRFTWSIFDSLPKWLRDYLTDNLPNVPEYFDGWHQTDGIIVLAPLALLLYWGNRLIFQISWWWALLLFAGISVFFYVAYFNPLYHYILMKKEFRGR